MSSQFEKIKSIEFSEILSSREVTSAHMNLTFLRCRLMLSFCIYQPNKQTNQQKLGFKKLKSNQKPKVSPLFLINVHTIQSENQLPSWSHSRWSPMPEPGRLSPPNLRWNDQCRLQVRAPIFLRTAGAEIAPEISIVLRKSKFLESK